MSKELTLKDTEKLMESSDYRERFIAEYWQTKIRYEKLKHFNTRIECQNAFNGPEVQHDCPNKLLRDQQTKMGELLHILEVRAILERINLNEIFEIEER
jgi:hypothetical protein